jgi:SAM-dependent methyltransferase
MENSLLDLGRLHGTDKVAHGYLPIYERFLEPMRRTAGTVLEIGVFKGASLRMWRDYFPAATVIGLDISPDKAALAGERIAIEIGNCGDAGFLKRAAAKYRPFDLVVDDGSHLWAHQQTAFDVLFDHVKPGGVYILEDLHTSYIQKYGSAGGRPTVQWMKDRLDLVLGGSEMDLSSYDQGSRDFLRWRRQVEQVVLLRKSALIVKR